MQPIVNGLTETYGDEITFLEYNAQEDDGAIIFESLGLRGHPAVLVVMPDGTEMFRAFGVVDEDLLVSVIESALR